MRDWFSMSVNAYTNDILCQLVVTSPVNSIFLRSSHKMIKAIGRKSVFAQGEGSSVVYCLTISMVYNDTTGICPPHSFQISFGKSALK